MIQSQVYKVTYALTNAPPNAYVYDIEVLANSEEEARKKVQSYLSSAYTVLKAELMKHS